MSKALRNLRLNEVSLVDNPANKSATVSLYKRDDAPESDDSEAAAVDDTEAGSPGNINPASQEHTMSEQDTEKRLGELETALSSLKGEVEKHGLSVEVGEDGSVSVAKAEADETVTDPDGNTVRKSEVGEAHFRTIKAMSTRLGEVEKQREREQLTKAAETRWPNVGGEPDQKGAIFGALSKIEDEATREAALKHFDSLDKMIASQMTEVGKSGGPSASEPMQKLETLAKERAEKTGETNEQAFAEVCKTDQGASLYDQHISERAN